ncbi:MAG TPA: glycosyltransferase family 2 protein, partial [Catenuloplanes sp.]
MNPNVAVIVICYNDAGRLPRAVASATAQSLANLEVIIVDDCSTDDTGQVAARLAARDPRIRYHRLPANSGGCSAPRNAGIELARAPYLMFLDSDDALPRDACESLMRVLDETGADFVTSRVERYYEFENTTKWWYQNLFRERRVIEGIRAAPEYLFDHLSTNKMYRRDFIERHQLRFPLGVHWEDQLWSAQAYCLAHRFAVAPWPGYKWWHAGEGTSISSSTQSLTGLADRITVAKLVDDFLTASDHADLRVDKDFKFLRHDLKIYLTELGSVDLDWIERFAALVVPYLDQLDPAAYLRLNRAERVCVHLLRRGRLAEAAEASLQVVRPERPPRLTT